MKYPKMNKQPKRTVSVPSLSGGINLRDSLNMCNDNQLTDSLNMWYKDGVLKTRAGKRKLKDYIFAVGAASDSRIEYDAVDIKEKCHSNITKIVGGKTYTLVSYLYAYTNYTVTYSDENNELITTSYANYSTLDFYWVGAEDTLNEYPMTISVEDKILNYFVTVSPKEMYLFLNRTFAKEIRKYNQENNYWDILPDREIYVPTIATNLTASKWGSGEVFAGGTMFEGYNFIGKRIKLVFSTVNKELFNSSGKHMMYYSIPSLYNVKDKIPDTVEVTIRYSNNNVLHKVTHTATKTNDNTYYRESKINTDDNLQLNINVRDNGEHSIIYFTNDDETTEGYGMVSESDYLENNMEVILPCECDEDKIFNMTQAEWFGGASQGIKGGTRLFLGGNTEENEQSLIVWSGLNNPLYFSENSYSYVGNPMSAVTAFGKQSDMLVIFKENELYYTRYTQNTEITAEDLINQKVVDYEASRVYFPLVQIHSGIGCDCPDTVQLCRNRLVWADSSGRVYTLTNSNQYSERNIFCLSDMIERKLMEERELKGAVSVDFDGYYILFCGGKAYLMEYNSYGYQYISSFSKEEDANIRIPWYCWDLGDELANSLYYTANNKLMCFSYGIGAAHRELCLYTFDSNTDDGEPIHCFAQTKFFDFGSPNYRKNIDSVGVTLGNNGGQPIIIRHITDCGEDCETVTLADNETDTRNAGFIASRILYPAIRQAVRYGTRFECEGNMAIEGINITYRITGGAR